MAKYGSAWEKQLKMSRPRYLLDAFLFDIQSRLPVKSILRFKSVCKNWDALFGDSQFIDAHLRQSVERSDCSHLILQRNENTANRRNDFCLCIDENFEELRELHCKIDLSSKICRPVALINGIMCIMRFEGFTKAILNILLWNPATRELRILPKLIDGYHFENTCRGFGFDPKNNDYKVVLISEDSTWWSDQVNVYSLKTDSWRGIGAYPYEFEPQLPVVYVNGRMHWLGRKLQKWMIVSFDVAQEKFIDMDKPEIEYPHKYKLALCESPASLGESLMFCNSKYCEGCEIWFMKEYGDSKSWTKLHYISLVEIPRNFMHMCMFLDNGKIIMKCDDSTKFLWDKNYQEYQVLNEHCDDRILKYRESLVSIKRAFED